MKLLGPKRNSPFSRVENYTGRMKGYKVKIFDHPDHFYFMLENGKYRFNSLWENPDGYADLDSAKNAAMAKIEQLKREEK